LRIDISGDLNVLNFVSHWENSVLAVGYIIGLVCMTRVPLGHVSDVDETIVSESDLVLAKVVGGTLEDSTSELGSLRGELSVHLVTISQEVFGVPELSGNFSVNIHLLESSLTLSLRDAICLASELGEVLASVKDEVEVGGAVLIVGRRVVLKLDRGATGNIWAPESSSVISEHSANIIGIPVIVALLALDDSVIDSIDIVIHALEPDASEILVLLSSN